ncbi:uncharacterized protein YALI1_B23554g [Yarrowia lipolytica]|uniref:Uncharacterized protein n=1 Tax=Yarrowia lipolytica TaxID=4952 RepID=A0A1D8N8B6_YARLL|nr:hypothetical protein YALI1_B23554g [Yarrowia lipolytica]
MHLCASVGVQALVQVCCETVGFCVGGITDFRDLWYQLGRISHGLGKCVLLYLAEVAIQVSQLSRYHTIPLAP